MNKMFKQTLGLGIGSMAASYGMGAVVDQMPAGAAKNSATGTMGVANAGLLMLNVGQLGKNAMGMTGMLNNGMKKKTGNAQIDKILG